MADQNLICFLLTKLYRQHYRLKDSLDKVFYKNNDFSTIIWAYMSKHSIFVYFNTSTNGNPWAEPGDVIPSNAAMVGATSTG
jgi:hypothetical protein